MGGLFYILDGLVAAGADKGMLVVGPTGLTLTTLWLVVPMTICALGWMHGSLEKCPATVAMNRREVMTRVKILVAALVISPVAAFML